MHRISLALGLVLFLAAPLRADDLATSIKADYDGYLAPLFEHFHRTPELSTVETKTAARMAEELRAAGFEVTEGVGGTGLVAMMENGDGPLVMMRADMDGLPIREQTGLEYASTKQQVSPITGETVYTMHACGHDVHITSLVGTARQMNRRRDAWQGTLMLVVQPAEETGAGAKAMKADRIWERFGQPDYALAFHVDADDPAGFVNVSEGSPYAGADSVDIIIHGVGGHGASPHQTKDPIVLGAQIVMALQTLVSRELPPRHAGVVTVGSFHAGTKHNIIPGEARLQLTVRNTSERTRRTLLEGIERIAHNLGRAAGLPEDRLPEVIVSEDFVPPTSNTPELAARLRGVWEEALGERNVGEIPTEGMGAEDFPFFTVDPEIPTVYWAVGGTPREAFEAAAAGGPPVAGHHSPFFRIAPEPSVRTGVASTVLALMELMPPQ